MRAPEAGEPKPGTRTPVTYDGTKHVMAPVSLDVFESGWGQLHVKGVTDDPSPAMDVFQEGGRWHVEQMADGSPSLSARTAADLLVKVADHFGVSGRLSVMDEERGKQSKGNKAFDYVARPRAAEDRLAATRPAHQTAAEDISPALVRLGDEIRAERARASVPVAGTGYAPLPTRRLPLNDTTDTVRQRREGEPEFLYNIRTAPSDDAARRFLGGYNLPALRSIFRDLGMTIPANPTKPRLIDALMEIRRREADAEAMKRMQAATRF